MAVPRLYITISQVLTGLRPFHHILARTPVPAVMRGERPKKPLGAESLGLSNALWELLQQCWNESASSRPTAQRLFGHLSSVSHTWVPPLVYPVIVTGVPSTADGDSSSLRASLDISQVVGTVNKRFACVCCRSAALPVSQNVPLLFFFKVGSSVYIILMLVWYCCWL